VCVYKSRFAYYVCERVSLRVCVSLRVRESLYVRACERVSWRVTCVRESLLTYVCVKGVSLRVCVCERVVLRVTCVRESLFACVCEREKQSFFACQRVSLRTCV